MKLRTLRTAIPAILLAVNLGFVGQPANALSSTPATVTSVASVESPQLAAVAYMPSTSANFRYNLVQRTRYDPGSRCHAHHTMPQKFSTFFGAKRITIHSPAYGLWWVSTAGVAGNHSSMAARYNRDWQNWISAHGKFDKGSSSSGQLSHGGQVPELLPVLRGEILPEWVRIQAKSGRRDVWLAVYGAGKPKITGDPWYMPDGITNVYPFIEDWRPEDLPFPVWLAPFNGGKSFGDMLWTGGISLKIASARFIKALEAAEVTGYRTFDVDLRDHTKSPVDGYMGFATDPFPGSDIQNLYGQDSQNFTFIANQRVVEALHQYGADKLDIQPYESAVSSCGCISGGQ